jgi:hypothetical protein
VADVVPQRVVMFTSETALSDELFLYMYAHLAASVPGVSVVAVRARPKSIRRKLARYCRKMWGLGFLASAEIISSVWLQKALKHRDEEELCQRLRSLARPDCRPDPASIDWVSSVNGPQAVEVLRSLCPAIIVQAGAGILRPCVFQIPALGALNLHHGIAPQIRGMESIYWGLWERRPEWIGSTVHFIDEGLDTGAPLAYFRVEPIGKGEGFSSLFARATEGGVANLVQVVQRLLAGEPLAAVPSVPSGEYRSTFSGWKMLLLSRRQKREREKTNRE